MKNHDHYFHMDMDSELTAIFVNHYDIIEGVISGKHKITQENDWI